MTKFALLGAAAVIISSTLAGPTIAQSVIDNPARCAAVYPNANCQNLGPGNPYTGNGYQRRAAYRNGAAMNRDGGWRDSQNDNRWDRRHDSGFWPADLAVGIAGAAIGTAGAIATAPFGNSYAYDNGGGYRGWDNRSYAERNGFVCQPGTWFKGQDGRRHICQ